MNIIFMGTPDFAVPTLEKLIASKHNILAVVTQPDRPKGRGKKVLPPPVKEVALKNNIDVLQPQKIREEAFINNLKMLNPDVMVVIAYGQILPKAILDIPQKGCINVHASLLPYYRGAAPIHWAIINGEKKSGVTTMFMDVGLDTGDMILKGEVDIPEDMSAGELHNILADMGAEVLLETLDLIEEDKAPREKQDHEKHTYAPMLNREVGEIDWNKSADEIINLIRGTNPWPGAYSLLEDEKLKIWKAAIYEGNNKYDIENNTSGRILDYIKEVGWIVQAGKGLVAIQLIQLPNSKKMDVDSYILGNGTKIGTILGKNRK